MEFVTRLQYEYAQVAVDLFYENLTTVHCSVAVYIHVSPFFLYLKECVIISKFGSTVLCGLGKRDKAYKEQSHCLTYTLTGLHEIW